LKFKALDKFLVLSFTWFVVATLAVSYIASEVFGFARGEGPKDWRGAEYIGFGFASVCYFLYCKIKFGK